MVACRVYFAVALWILCFDSCYNIKMIPERVFVGTMNASYVEDVKFSVRRYGRKSGYYVNAEGTIKHTWGNNISVQVDLFELLHNEYRPTFIQFRFARGCEFLNNDPYMGKALGTALNKTGMTCPVPPGHYILANMTLVVDKFPYLWPFQRAKAVGKLTCDGNFIGNGSIYFKIEQ